MTLIKKNAKETHESTSDLRRMRHAFDDPKNFF